MPTEHAHLSCDHCGQDAEHEFHYVGRLLESTRCTNCGHVVRHAPATMPVDYVHDLTQRVVSKPRRLAARALDDPVGFALSLPQAIVRQPLKFAREFLDAFRPR